MTSPFIKLFQSIPLNSKLSDLIEVAWGWIEEQKPALLQA